MDDAPQIRRQRTRRLAGPAVSWRDLATAVLPVLACFLGGATQKWAEGIVVLGVGVLILACPPRVSLGPVVNGALLGLLGLAALGFAPARWFREPAWREALVNDFGIPLGTMLSPQPWITASCLASLVAGMSWFYYVATQEVENRSARRQFRIFAGGVVLLAAIALAVHFMHGAVPFWHSHRGFGPFPNRNQTANLLALTAVIVLACGHDELRQHRKGWIFWLAGLAVLVAAIVLNFSRAGLVLLVAGSALWIAAMGLRSRSAGTIVAGVSAVLVLLTAILLFGGETLERFHLRTADGIGVSSDFRWLIFKDALQLIRSSPWSGVGLGNFESIFAVFRSASFAQARSLHPESDWLWLSAELGWPAVLLVIVAAAMLVRRVFPLREGTAQRFRLAALVSAVLFAAHGLADVSGHRVGTAYAGLFLFGLSLRRREDPQKSAVLPHVFRAVGAALVVLGATWVTAEYRHLSLPGSIGAENERRLAAAANAGRQSTDTIAHATQGLAWAPLDWQLYFLRALGKAGGKLPLQESLADFRRARFLEPNSFEVPYQEGVAWLQTQPTLAMTAWREALRRAGTERPALYDRMMSTASQLNPQVARMLQEFGSHEPDLALIYLARVQGPPFDTVLERLRARDPALATLTPAQKTQLFALWSERGDLDRLVAWAEAQPEIAPLAWRGIARQKAAHRDFAGAFEVARRFGAPPALPNATTTTSPEQLQRSLIADPRNYEAASVLYRQQMAAGSASDALITVRRMTDQPGAPAFFHFLEAEAWSARGEPERAWEAWVAFERATGK